MKDLKIQKATLSNLDELVNMQTSLHSHLEKANPSIWRYVEEERKTLLRKELSMFLTDKKSLILVPEVGEEIVGFGHGMVDYRIERIPSRVGIITTVYVQECWRRQFIGSRLVLELCQFFKDNNVQEVSVGYIVGNSEADRFWESFGFQPIRVTAITSITTIEERLKEKDEQNDL